MLVSQKEKIMFANHLAFMIKGGIPLVEALETLRDEAVGDFKQILDRVLKRVLEGESLSSGLQQYPKVFDNFFCRVIQVGEKSGAMAENLKYLAEQLRNSHELKKNAQGAAIYPLVVISLSLIVISVVSIFTLPKLISAFSAIGIEELPIATRILMSTVAFFSYWYWILGGIILATLGIKLIRRMPTVRFYFDKVMLFLPIIGPIIKNLNLAYFSQTFSTVAKSGMPVLECLDICADSSTNQVFKKNLKLIRAGVERGEKISEGAQKFPQIFPLIFSQTVSVGERTGQLEESLRYLADFYQDEAQTSLKKVSITIEPILLIAVGLFVAFLALAIFTPIYQFISELRGAVPR